MTARELLSRHLSFIGVGATAEETALVYSPNVVSEFPYAPPDHTRRLEGPDALIGFLGRIGTFAEDIVIHPPTIYDTATGLIAEYKGESVFKESGRKYEQDYVAVVTVEDGLITHISEYYDPLRVLRAMGEID